MDKDVIFHYDKLIEEGNDPVNDPELLKAYMDKWDGRAFIDKMQLSPDRSVLEIGVGTGRLAVRVAPLCSEFTGIDISPKTIARAKEHLAEFDNVSLICGDFIEYDFENRFDTVYSSLTFMHIENKQKAVDKVFGLLEPGGRFVLSIDKNQTPFIDLGIRKTHIYPDDPDKIKNYLRQAGFETEETTETEFAHILTAKRGSYAW